MTVRAAQFVDIPRLVDLIQRTHAGSIYAQRCSIDVKLLKATLLHAIEKHGGKKCGSSLVMVSEEAGIVTGLLLGLVDRVYVVMDRLYVTDLFYVCPNPRDALKMLARLLAWAKSIPGVIEVRLGATDAIGEWARVQRLYERLGMKQSGVMCSMRVG